MEKQMPVKVEQKDVEESWLFWAGPGCILSTLAVAVWSNQQELFYWLSICLLGMFFCSRYKMRGCIFVLTLFAMTTALRHYLALKEHIWNIGVEGSLSCGFLIMALASSQRKSILQALRKTAETQQSTIGHLEQNVAALMSSSQAQQIALQDKIAELQKELEEVQSELSSIVILNEVLRKTSASQMKETEQASEIVLDRERRIGVLIKEREELRQELVRYQKEFALHEENKKLLDELNQKRIDEEQVKCLAESFSHLQGELIQEKQRAELQAQAFQKEKQEFLSAISCQENLERENDKLLQELANLQEGYSLYKKQREEEWEKIHFELDERTKEILEKDQKIEEIFTEKQNLEKLLHETEKKLEAVQNGPIQDDLFRKDEAHVRTLEVSLKHLEEKLVEQEKIASERYHALALEKQKMKEEQVNLKGELFLSQAQVEQLSEELAQSLSSLQKIEEIRMENSVLQDRLRGAEMELANVFKRASSENFPSSLPKEAPAKQAEREELLKKLTEKEAYLAELEEKIKKSSQIESLYRQLKIQFEEKNKALHEVRANLFHSDTELQKLLLERAHKELEADPLSKAIEKEVMLFEKELVELRQENEELQQIISGLMKPT